MLYQPAEITHMHRQTVGSDTTATAAASAVSIRQHGPILLNPEGTKRVNVVGVSHVFPFAVSPNERCANKK